MLLTLDLLGCSGKWMPLVLNSFPGDQIQKIRKEMRGRFQTSCDVSPCLFTSDADGIFYKRKEYSLSFCRAWGSINSLSLTSMMALQVFLVLDFVEQHQSHGVATANYRRAEDIS